MKKISIISISFCFCCFQLTAQRILDIPQNEINQFMNHHNNVRKEVGSSPLNYNAVLSEYAAAWALYLAEKNDCNIRHRSNDERDGSRYGENIYWTSDSQVTSPLEASIGWYEEKPLYNHQTLDYSNYTDFGHYTQMIWKNTTSVGVGMAVCPDGKGVIIVANYDPPGNYIGQKAY